MQSIKELRTRLAQVSIDDLSAVHALHLKIAQAALARGPQAADYLEVMELNRRGERLLGQAVRAAQARGEVRSRGWNVRNTAPKAVAAEPVKKYFQNAMETECYAFAAASDEEFEAAITAVKATGTVGRGLLARTLNPPPKPMAVPTTRGKRTMEHMAIQINAIAMGVSELDPGEVSRDAGEVLDRVLEDLGIIRGWLRKVKANV